MSKAARGSTCTYERGSKCMDVYTDSMGVHGSTCSYISTKRTGVHGGTSTDDSTVNTVVQRRTNAYDKYGRYEPKRDIGTDTVQKVRKGISFAEALQKGFLVPMKL